MSPSTRPINPSSCDSTSFTSAEISAIERERILKSAYRSISSSLKSDQKEVSHGAVFVRVFLAVDGLHGPVWRVELMRLNSYFSWNSPTLPWSRSFEKL